MQLRFEILSHGSDAYAQMLRLRIQVLLQPIGIDPSFIEPEREKDDILIGAFESEKLVGCCVLTPKDAYTVQLRQMVVATNVQGKRIGTHLLDYAEQAAKANLFQTLMLHARGNVVPFYKKSGYVINGEPFEEVGIQHFRMEKSILHMP